MDGYPVEAGQAQDVDDMDGPRKEPEVPRYKVQPIVVEVTSGEPGGFNVGTFNAAVCDDCGALVWDRQDHDTFHAMLQLHMRSHSAHGFGPIA